MKWNFNEDKDPIEWKWFCLKLSVVTFWMLTLPRLITCCPKSPLPAGVYRIFNFDFLFSPIGTALLTAALLVLCFLYLLEKWMLLTTFCWFALCAIIVSHHESNGIFERNTLLTTVMGAQFVAYLIYHFNSNFDIRKFRVQYVYQIIAATYTLSAIAKLHSAGLAWAGSGTLFSLQVIKNHAFDYFSDGNPQHIQQGQAIANTVIQHRYLITLLFGGTLLLESCCFLAVFNERFRFGYGVALVLMHLGILATTNIIIGGIVFPMVIFYLNPLYYAYLYTTKAANVFYACLKKEATPI